MSGTNGKQSQVTELLEATTDLIKEPEGMNPPASERPTTKDLWLGWAFMAILTFYLTGVFMILLLPVFKLLGVK